MLKKVILIMGMAFSMILQVNAQQIINGFASPESVILSGNDMFVSNIGTELDPFAKDGDGFISKLTAGGKFIKQKFQQGKLNAPKGLAVAGNVIYVADIDRIVGFDISDGRQVFELTVEGALLLNDLCTINDSSIVVSDSFKDRVYLVNITNSRYTIAGHVEGPNGVTYDHKTKKLFVCTVGKNMNTQGKFFSKDITNTDTVFNELPNSSIGFFDGIEFMDNDHLIVSDWVKADAKQGKLWIYNLKNQSAKSLPFGQSPADIFYDKTAHKLYVPQTRLNRIFISSVAL